MCNKMYGNVTRSRRLKFQINSLARQDYFQVPNYIFTNRFMFDCYHLRTDLCLNRYKCGYYCSILMNIKNGKNLPTENIFVF